MLKKPTFKPHYQVNIIPGQGVLFMAEMGVQSLLSGKIYEALVAQIDGKKTSAEIISHLSDSYSWLTLQYALLRLQEKGFIIESSFESFSIENAAFWSAHGVFSSEKISQQLAQASVSIHAIGNVDVTSLLGDFKQLGIQVVSTNAALNIVVSDDYFSQELIEYNKTALNAKKPWILVRPKGIESWIGPLFVPNQTACYECLLQRLKHHQIEKMWLLANSQNQAPAIVEMSALNQSKDLTYNLLSVEVTKYFVDATACNLVGKILSVDQRNWKTCYHILHREVYCKACGIQTRAEARPIVLRSNKIVHRNGGYRSVSVEKVLKKFKQFVSPITGFMEDLIPMHHGKVYIYSTAHNWLRNFSKDVLKQFESNNFCRWSSGKGITKAQAKASAICEAFERYSGMFQGNESCIQASYQQLQDRAIHPDLLMLYSKRQYANRKILNQRFLSYDHVSQPFKDDVLMSWTPAWSLTKKQFRYLPTQFTFFNVGKKESAYCFGDSNGCAAGYTLEEAILQGFFELVERDSIAIWWYNRLQRPEIDIKSFNKPEWNNLFSEYKKDNLQVWAIDITADLNIPTVAVICREIATGYLCFGFGCHLDITIAIERALTEMHQMYPMLHFVKQLALDPHRRVNKKIKSVQDWCDTARLETEFYLQPLDQPAHTAKDYKIPAFDDILDAIQVCQEIVESKGLEFLVVNQTRPEIGLAVVKVVIPGLRHFWTRFAPGRLYDVPVQMGWLDHPRLEEELNPISMFI